MSERDRKKTSKIQCVKIEEKSINFQFHGGNWNDEALQWDIIVYWSENSVKRVRTNTCYVWMCSVYECLLIQCVRVSLVCIVLWCYECMECSDIDHTHWEKRKTQYDS